MTAVDGTVKVWTGTEWVLTVASGAPAGGDPAELVERFTFAGGDTTGWTVSDTWSEDPADWVTAAGNGVGTTFLRRTQPEGCHYFEMDFYMETTGEDWAGLRPFDGSGAVYDNGSAGALVRGNGGILVPWDGGAAESGAGAGDLTGDDLPSPDEAHMITLGVWVGSGASAGTVEVYVNGVFRMRQTGMTDPNARTMLTVGCYNNARAHIHEVRCYSAIPA